MKRAGALFFMLISLLLITAVAAPVAAQSAFTCTDGSNLTITNAVEFTMGVPQGGYRVTALGLNGFDTVLAITDPSTGDHLCNDDEPGAASYAADLPSTGAIAPLSTNAQLDFSNGGTGFLAITILAGGLNGATGEFALLIEGMQVTTDDGAGDLYDITTTQNLIDSGVGVHAYMIHATPGLDPLLAIVDENSNVITTDSGPVICDDSGNAQSCWRMNASDPAVSLEGATLTDGSGVITANASDSYIYVPTEALDAALPVITYLATSYSDSTHPQTTGSYVFVFHTGIGQQGGAVRPTSVPGGLATATPGGSGSLSTPVPHGQSTSTPVPHGQPTSTPSGTTVIDATPIDCTVNGTQFDGDLESYLNVECPAGCTSGSLWGTTTYTDDSSICTAGIHAGLIPASGGQFAVVIAAGQDSYEGSTANGITSSGWGAWTRSIRVEPVIVEGANTPVAPTGTPGGNANTDETIWAITYGDSGNTQVDTVGGDTFVFDGRVGDIVTIAVNSTAFDPLIIVTDVNGRELARDDDSGPGFNALISNLRIPADGQYLIKVTSLSGAVNLGAAYDISLTNTR